MATKTSLPNENAWMNITKTHIEDLGRLNWLIRNIFASPSAVENLRKVAIVPKKKLDALLKLVDVVVNDDGTMNVGRFLVKPIPRGRQIMGSMRGSITGEIVTIEPLDRQAGKTRRRKKKGKATRRR